MSGEIRIYTADVTPLNSEDVFETVYRSVSERRRAKTDRLRFMKDKCLSLGAEYLLMRACRDFGADYANEPVTETGNGKPAFEKCPAFFNLSHSENTAMCVMSYVPVGCDVEKIADAGFGVAKRFFSADEYAELENCKTDAERRDMFYRLWTLKESFMKCTGLGFKLPARSFSISAGSGGIAVTQNVDGSHYSFFEKRTDDGYRYAVCAKDYSPAGDETIEKNINWHTVVISG